MDKLSFSFGRWYDLPDWTDISEKWNKGQILQRKDFFRIEDQGYQDPWSVE